MTYTVLAGEAREQRGEPTGDAREAQLRALNAARETGRAEVKAEDGRTVVTIVCD